MPEEAVRAQLDALIRKSGQSYAEISRLIGRNAAYVQQYVKRGVPRRLAEADRRALSAHFHVPEAVLGGPAPTVQTLAPDSSRHPTLEISYLVSNQRFLTIDAAFVAGITAGIGPTPATALAALLVDGDSMAPTLFQGDHLLIDLSDRGPSRDGVYVIEGDRAPLVRRLSMNPVTHRIAILSDNAAYPSFPDCDPAEIRVLGRVVWVGRSLP